MSFPPLFVFVILFIWGHLGESKCSIVRKGSKEAALHLFMERHDGDSEGGQIDHRTVQTETGSIVALKSNFGFIRKSEANGKIFFHFSSLIGGLSPEDLRIGDLVKFSVAIRHGKPHAAQVRRSTPLLTEYTRVHNSDIIHKAEDLFVDAEKSIALIVHVNTPNETGTNDVYGFAQLESTQQQKADLGDQTTLSQHNLLPFRRNDIISIGGNSGELQVGDVVECNIVRGKDDLDASKTGITNLRLFSPVGPREMGSICSLKNSYGFISYSNQHVKQLFFHFSEILNQTQPFKIGSLVEFTKSKNEKGQDQAMRVVILPDSPETKVIRPDRIQGVVVIGTEPGVNHMRGHSQLEHLRLSNSRSVINENALISGSIEYTEFGQRSNVIFSVKDLVRSHVVLKPGDIVEFTLLFDKRLNLSYALDVQLIKPVSFGRVFGAITVLKGHYGFIRYPGSPMPLFFHFNEFYQAHVDAFGDTVTKRKNLTLNLQHIVPAIGDLLEFNIAPDNRGEDNAVRIKLEYPLKNSWLKFCSPQRLHGMVVQEPGRSFIGDWDESIDSDDLPLVGAVQVSPEFVHFLFEEASQYISHSESVPSYLAQLPVVLPFLSTDLIDPNIALKIQDTLEFDLVFDSTESEGLTFRASKVSFIPKVGTVSKIVGGIKGQIIDVSREVFNFSLDDVRGSFSVSVGDKVSFTRCSVTSGNNSGSRNSKLRRIAQDIRVLQTTMSSISISPLTSKTQNYNGRVLNSRRFPNIENGLSNLLSNKNIEGATLSRPTRPSYFTSSGVNFYSGISQEDPQFRESSVFSPKDYN